jgi:hypothetical protein
MRRILLVLSVAALMAAMVLALAVPAFAQATVDKFGPCGTGTGVPGERCQVVTTPSGELNVQVHHRHPPGSIPAEGRGADRHEVPCVLSAGDATTTPSDNINVHCHGST